MLQRDGWAVKLVLRHQPKQLWVNQSAFQRCSKPGPGLRGQLEALLEAVITGQLPNERKALLAAVKIELDP